MGLGSKCSTFLASTLSRHLNLVDVKVDLRARDGKKVHDEQEGLPGEGGVWVAGTSSQVTRNACLSSFLLSSTEPCLPLSSLICLFVCLIICLSVCLIFFLPAHDHVCSRMHYGEAPALTEMLQCNHHKRTILKEVAVEEVVLNAIATEGGRCSRSARGNMVRPRWWSMCSRLRCHKCHSQIAGLL